MKLPAFQKLPIWILIPVGILLLSLSGCSDDENSGSGKRETIRADVEEAVLISFEQSIPYSGTVYSKRSAGISTKVAGEITEMTVNIGDTVKTGDLLFKIRNDNLSGKKESILANIEQAEASLKNTETQYNRIKALFQNDSATQKEFDDAATQLAIAKSQLDALGGQLREIDDLLSYTVLKAPFNSTVAERFSEGGDMASPGRPVLKLNETGTFKIRVTLPEEAIDHFETGRRALVNVPSAKIENSIAFVTAVNRSGSPQSRQFDGELEFEQPGINIQKLMPGQFASVRRVFESEPLVAVRSNAIIEKGQLTGLYTLSSNNRIFLRWIRTGKTDGEFTEVLSGIKPGDKYIIPNDERLLEGLFVETQQISN